MLVSINTTDSDKSLKSSENVSTLSELLQRFRELPAELLPSSVPWWKTSTLLKFLYKCFLVKSPIYQIVTRSFHPCSFFCYFFPSVFDCYMTSQGVYIRGTRVTVPGRGEASVVDAGSCGVQSLVQEMVLVRM